MKNKLFIAGCARSGTSALAQLLGSNDKVVMGMERFGHLYNKNKFEASADLFETKRFLTIEDGDTFYTDLEKFHAWDPNIIKKLESVNYEYIGDKRPEIYEVYDEMFNTFPDSKIIFIYRNLYEVAASWNKRAEAKENWPATKDFKKAVYAWNDSLRLTVEAIDKYPNQIACIRYEDVFVNAIDLKPLYAWLNIDMDANTHSKLKNILINSKRLQDERKSFQLSDEQKLFCDSTANFRFEKELNNIKII
ncbi:sulfotransferase family protein [Arcobacter peruensis]|uniref:sulfotransferase family protein n=1 Tax=Arcobacter peruensis TaxID=2320140 RepID=UPI000F09136D|nr:sulfotransferase [Arcobacter peruensis]